jgi:hypothetical protein
MHGVSVVVNIVTELFALCRGVTMVGLPFCPQR